MFYFVIVMSPDILPVSDVSVLFNARSSCQSVPMEVCSERKTCNEKKVSVLRERLVLWQ